MARTREHKGMLVTISQAKKGKKPFRLFNSWLEDDEFLNLAKAGLSNQLRGVGLFRIQEKLKRVKELTKEWAKARGYFDKQYSSFRPRSWSWNPPQPPYPSRPTALKREIRSEQ